MKCVGGRNVSPFLRSLEKQDVILLGIRTPEIVCSRVSEGSPDIVQGFTTPV